jgi:hypothetical protein
MAVSVAPIDRCESRQFCDIFSLIHRKLTGAKVVEFMLLDNGTRHVGFSHGCHQYVALFTDGGALQHVLEDLPEPIDDEDETTDWAETNYSKWVFGVLSGQTRNDAGELVDVHSRFPLVAAVQS